MNARQFETSRGILVRGLSLDFAAGKVVEYGELTGGEKQPHQLALSAVERGWILVGVPANMTRYNFHNLACWFLGVTGDSEHATDVIAVSVPEGDPEQAYYLVPDEEAKDAVFMGRREDGASLSVNIPMGTVKVSRGGARLHEPLLDFLRGRDIPESLLAGPSGFEVTPEREVTIEVEEYEP